MAISREQSIALLRSRAPAEVVEESTASIVRSAFSDIGDIVRAEVALAKIEIKEDAKKLGRTVPMGSAGLVLALFGLVFLLHTVALALDLVLPGWAAYLITAALTLIVGGALILVAAKRLRDWKSFVPERTIATLEENEQWIRQKLT